MHEDFLIINAQVQPSKLKHCMCAIKLFMWKDFLILEGLGHS